MRRLVLFALLAGAGCEQILGITDVGTDDAATSDLPDGAPPGSDLAHRSDGSIARDGAIPPDLEMPDLIDPCAKCGALGCCVDHCCAVIPSNAADVGMLAPTGLNVAPPNGNFDTDADCQPASALGNCSVAMPMNSPAICVCRADTLTIGTLTVTGSRALALLVNDTVLVTTSLSVGAVAGTPGPGAIDFAGGKVDSGGSYGTVGGSGGPAVYGSETIVPLQGGMGGYSGCPKQGGGGGGALQITAGTSLTVNGTVDAGGGGGGGGQVAQCSGGAGGGAGGGILLEAPTVSAPGIVTANGGGGGGGASTGYITGGGGSGENGQPTTKPAFGGTGNSGHGCALEGYTTGGGGGEGATASNAAANGNFGSTISGCLGGSDTTWVGGGGGGVGRIRVNSKSGCQCGGTFSPMPSFGVVTIQ
jgi:hypothetical protein